MECGVSGVEKRMVFFSMIQMEDREQESGVEGRCQREGGSTRSVLAFEEN